jgi:general secretion pathway protein G
MNLLKLNLWRYLETLTQAHHQVARRRAATAIKVMPRASLGMTLIEIMVVIVIIGVLGSALAVGVFGMLGDAKMDACKAQIATVGGVIEAYEARHGEFPGSLQELVEAKHAKLKAGNLKDPWMRDLVYGAQNEGFTLCSTGEDKKSGTEDDICYGANDK